MVEVLPVVAPGVEMVTAVPAMVKLDNTTKQVTAARQAMCRRCSGPACAVMLRKVGTAAIGSTRKKIEVKATKENCRRSMTIANIQTSEPRTCSILTTFRYDWDLGVN